MMRRDWKTVLVKAWSIRFTGAAIFFGALEVGFSLIDPDMLGIPRASFAALAMACSVAAGIARLMAQKGLTK
jgi:hypothetical protein